MQMITVTSPRADYAALPDLLRVDEAAAIARCSRQYISRLCMSGRIPAIKVARSWRIRKDAFLEYLGIKA